MSQLSAALGLGAMPGDDFGKESPDRPRLGVRSPAVVGTAAGLLLGAALFVALTRMRPGYDAYGWLDWGRQALHGHLNTSAAPSWKPLTFLFTLLYALAGGAQQWLWMTTAVAAALAAPLFAARIAYRLATGQGDRRYPAALAALFAAAAILGLKDYWHQVLIANSDPAIVALCLGAIDAHLCGRRRLAFAALLLAAWGRPEAWPLLLAYAGSLWRTDAGMRAPAVLALASVPALWFGVAALTSGSWFRAGQVALGTHHALAHDQVRGTLRLFLALGAFPLWVAVLGALIWAAIRRERVVMLLCGAALVWLAIETAFIAYGWPAEGRYLMPAAAVLLVIAAAGLGRLLAARPGVGAGWRWAAAALVLALCASLVPTARHRTSAARYWIALGRVKAKQMSQLADVIADDGGPGRILACGQPTTLVGLQSALAYELNMNVGFVGHKPGKAIHHDHPIVLFKPHDGAWLVRPIHTLPAASASCAELLVNPGPTSRFVSRRVSSNPDARADRARPGRHRHRRSRAGRGATNRHRARHRPCSRCSGRRRRARSRRTRAGRRSPRLAA